MLSKVKLSITFWPYAVQTAAYILNRTAVGPIINGKPTSPEEIWTEKKPHIHHMRVWECKCFVHIFDNKRLFKLHSRAEKELFINYINIKFQYKVYIIFSKRVNIFDAKCVKFRERVLEKSIIESNSKNSNSRRDLQLSSNNIIIQSFTFILSIDKINPNFNVISESVRIVKSFSETLSNDKTIKIESVFSSYK